MNVGIIGVSGYTGFELIRLILSHPYFKLTYVAASNQAKLADIFESLKDVLDIDVSKADANEAAKKCDLVFLALPHQEAMGYAKILIQNGVKVVDLSADYRLSKELYEKNYCSHLDTTNLSHAIYGLPELNRQRIKTASLVANPGCYPTASILAILPFLEYIDTKFGVMIDAKSGVSGAGKKLSTSSHFVSANENVNAYSPISHRHADEIKFHLQNVKNDAISVLFVPHLVPITRGMLVSVYAKINKKIDPLEILSQYYKNEKFIRVRDKAVSVKNVAGSHFCDIFAKAHEGKIFINSAIDNLLRGASSQAVANANLMCGYDETLSLPRITQFC
ncbi:N-acetyl-gamma-glutamyl-phosphate reductase [Campylobacter majalis]|uniref:N-acetyl-gamma-glutamyl-phosphate reductase n=1 Tax=Campylobacter majalis TaxID=2790656 RepID=UPI003D68C2F9